MRDTHFWISVLAALALTVGGCASTPNYAGMTAQEIYDRAVEHLEAEEWELAAQGFETLLFSYPTFERAAEARIHLAEAFYGQEQYLSAASEYQRVVTRFGNDPAAPRAALGICRSHVQLSPIVQRDQEYTREAIRSCSNVGDQFPGTEAAQQATALRDSMVSKLAQKDYERGEFYFNRGWYDSALVFLQDVLERYPRTPVAPKALLRMYEAYVEIGYSEEAEATRRRLLDEYPESSAAAEVRSNVDGPSELRAGDARDDAGGTDGGASSGG